MKVICQKNCSKKVSKAVSKKQMAYIGENAFLSRRPNMQIEVLQCEKPKTIIKEINY